MKMTPLSSLCCAVALSVSILLLTACNGGGTGRFTPKVPNPSPTEPADDSAVTPENIAFTSLNNVAPRLDYGSEKLSLTGIDETLAISIEGENCRLVINDEVIEGSSGELRNADTLRIIARAPFHPESAAMCILDVGNEPVSFSVTTGPNNGTFHVTPGAVHTSWNAYNASALSSYEIRGRLAGRPESGVMLVDKFSPEITSHTFEVNSLEVDWGNDFLSVWACSNLVGTGITNGYSPCQALMDIDRKLEQALSVDAIGYFKPSNTHEGMTFGNAIAMNGSGDVMVIAASGDHSNATGIDGNQDDRSAINSGAVFVFRKINEEWQQEAYIKASNTNLADNFGQSVALNAAGNVLAVGAHREDSSATGINGDQADNDASNSGAVYVFRNNGEGWSQDAYIKASNTDAMDRFGSSVALNAAGDRLAVGAPNEDSNATGVIAGNGFPEGNDNSSDRSGAVYLFSHDGNNWSQQAYVKRSVNTDGAVFGWSVALNAPGDVLAAGAPTDGPVENGHVYVFHETGGTWAQSERLQAPESPEAGWFGLAIALSDDGNILGVGMPSDGNTPEFSQGSVFLFQRTGGAWSADPVATLNAPNAHVNMQFGQSLALSGDGKRLSVSGVREGSQATGINGDQSVTESCANLEIGCLSPATGAVYLFENSSGDWQQTHYLKAPTMNPLGWTGWVLATNGNGDKLAATAYEHSAATGINGNQVHDCAEDEPEYCAEMSGAVYLFE